VISDAVFAEKLDAALKAQGILKRDRVRIIKRELTVVPLHCRDNFLDAAELKAGVFIKQKKEAKTIPSEHSEQCDFVAWFRAQYPGVLIFAIPNGGHRDKREAHNLKMEGVWPGVADLYVPKWRLWIEMKRQNGGDWSQEQQDFKKYVEEECGDTYVLGCGFEDAKIKALNYLTINAKSL